MKTTSYTLAGTKKLWDEADEAESRANDLKFQVARALYHFWKVEGLTQKQIAAGVGRSQQAVSRVLRIADTYKDTPDDKLPNYWDAFQEEAQPKRVNAARTAPNATPKKVVFEQIADLAGRIENLLFEGKLDDEDIAMIKLAFEQIDKLLANKITMVSDAKAALKEVEKTFGKTFKDAAVARFHPKATASA